MALEAGTVVPHEATLLGLRQVVRKAGAPKQTDVGKKEVDGLRDKGVDEETVVFLGLGQAHLVHVVPAAEKAAFDPGDEQAEETIPFPAEAGDGEDDFLDGDAGENGLIHQHRGKDFPVSGEKFLQEGGAAARWRDDKDGPADFLALEPGKEDVVQGSPESDDHPKAGEKQEKKGGDQPAPEPERLPQIGVEKGFGS